MTLELAPSTILKIRRTIVNSIKRSALALILIAMLLAPVSFAQQPTQDVQQAAARLAGSVLVGGRAMKYLGDLTDKFGGRLTGSPSYNRSAEWAAEQFRGMGIKNVKLEPFTIPNGWERGY